MKKTAGLLMLMLITVLVMFGCSGGVGGSANTPAGSSGADTGGGGNTPTVGGGDTSTPSGGNNAAVGYLVINFADGQAHLRAATSPTLPSADHARVVVRMTGVNEDGDSYTSFKLVNDVAAGDTATIELPAGNGYTVDVVSYKAGTPNLVLKYAQAPVDIQSGVTSNLSMTLSPINTTITAPDSVASGGIYAVAINNLVFPLGNDKKNLKVSEAPISALGSYSAADDSFLRTAPTLSVSSPATTLYVQGLFFLDAELLNAGDVFSDWVYGYPISTWGDTGESVSVEAPGAISITVTL